MILTSTFKLSALLLESRISDFVKKYSNVPPEMQKKLVHEDPSKNKKYIDWMGNVVSKWIEEKYIIPEHGDTEAKLNSLIKHVKLFDARLAMSKIKDIYAFKNYGEFSEFTNNLENTLSKREKIARESTILYEDDRFYIIAPESFEASGDFSANQTKWCVAANEHHWNDYRTKGTLIYIEDANGKYPYHKLAIFAEEGNGNNHKYWKIFDQDDHNANHNILNDIPKVAMSDIADYVNNDEERIQEDRQEKEEQEQEEWITKRWNELLNDVIKLIIDHYNVENIVDADEVFEALKESLGEEALKVRARNIFYNLVSYNGWEDGVYVGHNYERFKSSIDGGYENDEIDNFLSKVEEYIIDAGYSDKISPIILDAIGEHAYTILIKKINLDKILMNAIKTYNNYMNKNQGTLPDMGNSTKERFIPTDISSIVRMFTLGGYEDIGNFIKSYSRQKIYERTIRLKDLILC